MMELASFTKKWNMQILGFLALLEDSDDETNLNEEIILQELMNWVSTEGKYYIPAWSETVNNYRMSMAAISDKKSTSTVLSRLRILWKLRGDLKEREKTLPEKAEGIKRGIDRLFFPWGKIKNR